jgi:hypothetical protein
MQGVPLDREETHYINMFLERDRLEIARVNYLDCVFSSARRGGSIICVKVG